MNDQELIDSINLLLVQMDHDTVTALFNVLLRMSEKEKNAAPS